jgi:hypothetical protein
MTQFGADASDVTSSAEPANSSRILAVNGLQWRLRSETNLDHLEAQIKAAMRSGEPFAIETEARTPTAGRHASC